MLNLKKITLIFLALLFSQNLLAQDKNVGDFFDRDEINKPIVVVDPDPLLDSKKNTQGKSKESDVKIEKSEQNQQNDPANFYGTTKKKDAFDVLPTAFYEKINGYLKDNNIATKLDAESARRLAKEDSNLGKPKLDQNSQNYFQGLSGQMSGIQSNGYAKKNSKQQKKVEISPANLNLNIDSNPSTYGFGKKIKSADEIIKENAPKVENSDPLIELKDSQKVEQKVRAQVALIFTLKGEEQAKSLIRKYQTLVRQRRVAGAGIFILNYTKEKMKKMDDEYRAQLQNPKIKTYNSLEEARKEIADSMSKNIYAVDILELNKLGFSEERSASVNEVISKRKVKASPTWIFRFADKNGEISDHYFEGDAEPLAFFDKEGNFIKEYQQEELLVEGPQSLKDNPQVDIPPLLLFHSPLKRIFHPKVGSADPIKPYDSSEPIFIY